MKTWKEYVEMQEELEEGVFDTVRRFGQKAALVGALAGSGAGVANAANTTSPDAASYFTAPAGQTMSKYSWSSEIGKFTYSQDKDGSYIYHTKKGDFKRIPSKFNPTGYKFVRIN